ncbi:hypothetical protein [Sulfitobacter sp.]|uniref:hypothetical protein n=1 Tax=Sulfitobacter sp. TaxID=1903071 RepID=UPI0030035845
MEIFFVLILAVFVAGLAVAIYEWRKKRTLLEHDLKLQPHEDGHILAARVHAEDVTFHRRSGFDR